MTSADEIRFTAPDGTYWTVYEIGASAARPWAAKSLIFVSEAGFRRVYGYPHDWRDLNADALYELSWHR